jgi:uncharacterized protein YqgC (DUF456 family)
VDGFLTIALEVVGLMVALAGFVGCILPIIPGPPLGFAALLVLSFALHWEPFSAKFLVVMGVLAGFVSVLDYLVPVAGAKKYGASMFGVWGSIIGLVGGFFLFSVLGMFIGGLAGAFAGELLAGRTKKQALRAGWGAFIGNLFGIGLKMAYCGGVLFFYLKAML